MEENSYSFEFCIYSKLPLPIKAICNASQMLPVWLRRPNNEYFIDALDIIEWQIIRLSCMCLAKYQLVYFNGAICSLVIILMHVNLHFLPAFGASSSSRQCVHKQQIRMSTKSFIVRISVISLFVQWRLSVHYTGCHWGRVGRRFVLVCMQYKTMKSSGKIMLHISPFWKMHAF